MKYKIDATNGMTYYIQSEQHGPAAVVRAIEARTEFKYQNGKGTVAFNPDQVVAVVKQVG